MITAKNFMPLGAPFHVIGGDTLAPSHVYFEGKVPLLVNAELVSDNVFEVETVASMVSFLHENSKPKSKNRITLTDSMRLSLLFLLLLFGVGCRC